MPDDSTVYLALSHTRFSELVSETLAWFDDYPLPPGQAAPRSYTLLQRWISLQMADTRLAVLPGTTSAQQAHITELLAESRQRAQKVAELTEDLQARDKRIAELKAENERLMAAFEASGADLSAL